MTMHSTSAALFQFLCSVRRFVVLVGHFHALNLSAMGWLRVDFRDDFLHLSDGIMTPGDQLSLFVWL